MDVPNQRKGSISNAHVGKAFEARAHNYFLKQGFNLTSGIMVKVGINGHKLHRFDLGDMKEKILVECKSHTWTEGKNVPSAKMTTWNEAMFLFLAAPNIYQKILFVLRDFSRERNETLAQYYFRTNSHLIPKGVEILEFDERKGTAKRIT